MAHPDLDELLNVVLPFAQQMVGKHGEFRPVGASLSEEGEVVLAAGLPDAAAATAENAIETMIARFREQASRGEVRATVICYDSRVAPPGQTTKTDAICALLEHESGECTTVFLPYRKSWFGGLKFGDLFASPADARVFLARTD